MCLAFLVAIVGVTAAWFANTVRLSDKIVVTSAKPSNTVFIHIETGIKPDVDDLLFPAVAREGWATYNHGDAAAFNFTALPNFTPTPNSSLPDKGVIPGVLNKGLVGDTSAHPLEKQATFVDVFFDFEYRGTPTANGGKAVVMSLINVTLQNPRDPETHEDLSAGWVDYSDEFAFIFSIVKIADGLQAGEKPKSEHNASNQFVPKIYNATPSYTLVQSTATDTLTNIDDIYYTRTGENTVNMNIVPYTVYTFHAIIFFSKIDEFTSYDLLGTDVFFNFEIALAT